MLEGWDAENNEAHSSSVMLGCPRMAGQVFTSTLTF
jgi:hypothetical protein